MCQDFLWAEGDLISTVQDHLERKRENGDFIGNILFLICYTFFRNCPLSSSELFCQDWNHHSLYYITEQTKNMGFGLWNAPSHKKRKDLHAIWSVSNFPWHFNWLKSHEANTANFSKLYEVIQTQNCRVKSYKHRLLELGETWAPLGQYFTN